MNRPARPGQAFRVGPCHKCGSPMRIRSNGATRTTFAGCSAFPTCRFTVAFPPLRPATRSG